MREREMRTESIVACNNSFKEKTERFQVDTQLCSTLRGFLCATETALSHQPRTRIDVSVSVGSDFGLKEDYGKRDEPKSKPVVQE